MFGIFILEMVSQSVNEINDYKEVVRTAPATPGLSNIYIYINM